MQPVNPLKQGTGICDLKYTTIRISNLAWSWSIGLWSFSFTFLIFQLDKEQMEEIQNMKKEETQKACEELEKWKKQNEKNIKKTKTVNAKPLQDSKQMNKEVVIKNERGKYNWYERVSIFLSLLLAIALCEIF